MDLEFSYKLPTDLKLTLNPRGVRIASDDDEADPFQREEHSPVREIETLDFEVGDPAKTVPASTMPSAERRKDQLSPGGEPEPEMIKSSMDSTQQPKTNLDDEADDEYSDTFSHDDDEGTADVEDKNIRELRRE